MSDQAMIAEIALRGATAGVNLLVAGTILLSKAPRIRRYLGGFFLWGVLIYILISGPKDVDILGPLEPPLRIFAIFNSVAFWWFALSLFDDNFRLKRWMFLPAIFVLLTHLPFSHVAFHSTDDIAHLFVHASLTISIMAHAVWVALHDRADDLVDPRRRFRVVFAVLVGVFAIIITLGESVVSLKAHAPGWLTLLHAASLAGVSFFFAFWFLRANSLLLGRVDQPIENQAARKDVSQGGAAVEPADRAAFERLTELMDQGAYREEGLTVPRLAERVGVPEHQLRRLINRQLGFRNFSAFLNERRITDAKAILADPAQARKQILQIALALGYNSIAPFNRAFKDATELTPTEYRKRALNGD